MRLPKLIREPSQGAVDEGRTLFADDPLKMTRHVTLAARVDRHLDRYGQGRIRFGSRARGWASRGLLHRRPDPREEPTSAGAGLDDVAG